MKTKKIDVGMWLYFLFILFIIVFGAYCSYIEWSNKFMLNNYLKNEVNK